MSSNSRGLTIEEGKELLEYIQKNNSWENNLMDSAENKKKKIVKYCQFTMDTRFGEIWGVKFYDLINCDQKEVFFRTEQGYDLKETIYKWLDGNLDYSEIVNMLNKRMKEFLKK